MHSFMFCLGLSEASSFGTDKFFNENQHRNGVVWLIENIFDSVTNMNAFSSPNGFSLHKIKGGF